MSSVTSINSIRSIKPFVSENPSRYFTISLTFGAFFFSLDRRRHVELWFSSNETIIAKTPWALSFSTPRIRLAFIPSVRFSFVVCQRRCLSSNKISPAQFRRSDLSAIASIESEKAALRVRVVRMETKSSAHLFKSRRGGTSGMKFVETAPPPPPVPMKFSESRET